MIFEREGDVNYSVGFPVFVHGDRGIPFLINGPGFYRVMKEHGAELMKELGVKSLEGYVTDAHAELMRQALKGVAEITDRGRGTMAGLDMVWIVVEAK